MLGSDNLFRLDLQERSLVLDDVGASLVAVDMGGTAFAPRCGFVRPKPGGEVDTTGVRELDCSAVPLLLLSSRLRRISSIQLASKCSLSLGIFAYVWPLMWETRGALSMSSYCFGFIGSVLAPDLMSFETVGRGSQKPWLG